MRLSQDSALRMLNEECMENFGCKAEEATKKQIYKALCISVKNLLAKERADFAEKTKKGEKKQVYYMSMEFLVGTSLRNNLYNLGIIDPFKKAVEKSGFDIEELYALEPDAGLGNGGLGRLASCYMDSASSQNIPMTGFSIRYEFGIFKQKIVDGWQMEFPDNWLEMGDVWLNCREDDSVIVKFGGSVHEFMEDGNLKFNHVDYTSVVAVPYDMYISGAGSKAINKLVLWSAKSPNRIDMSAFSRGEYAKALEQNTIAEVISKVLYPADEHIEGKTLRLRQQYFFVSASLQSVVNAHYNKYKTLDNFADKAAIHINDTHPALCVPELMRILMDEYGYGWDKAWEITTNTLSYTNHTVMNEALERWSEHLFCQQLPRVYQIVCEINRRLMIKLNDVYGGDIPKIEYMAVISGGEVRMANMCLAACHKVNGVSKLHSDILTKSIFRDYYNIMPDKFTNVTNGIAYRRWLCQSNPALTDYLKELIGNKFLKDAAALSGLLKYEGDKEVLANLRKIKKANKMRLAKYIEKANGIKVNPNSIFDVQIKRLHEYKRQLLNVLHIMYMYKKLKEDPALDIPPRTFIFAAKASSGYMMAKQIISLIHAVAGTVNNDPEINGKIKVVFIEDYKVSLAEIIIPAAEISEQISIAGKEASGTGNMKLMINGAVTIGTLDGANVEISEQVGRENMFIFGMTADEVEAKWQSGYDPEYYYNSNPEIRAVIDMLVDGSLGKTFYDIKHSLLKGNYGVADAYMTLADFGDYVRAHDDISMTYKNADKFTNMSLVNIAKAGIFSSDRAILEYAKNIWKL